MILLLPPVGIAQKPHSKHATNYVHVCFDETNNIFVCKLLHEQLQSRYDYKDIASASVDKILHIVMARAISSIWKLKNLQRNALINYFYRHRN